MKSRKILQKEYIYITCTHSCSVHCTHYPREQKTETKTVFKGLNYYYILSCLLPFMSNISNMCGAVSFTCQVCSDQLPRKQMHYGVLSCQSCRVFFRRVVLKMSSPGSTIRNCSAKKTDCTTFPCSSCRLETCLRYTSERNLKKLT